MVALAVLMPIVASLGGNAATQAMTVTVRAIATSELTEHNAPRITLRELGVGFFNGIAVAILLGSVAGVLVSKRASRGGHRRGLGIKHVRGGARGHAYSSGAATRGL
jgi:Mg/Co/Ni transporter MgtE